MVQFGCSLACLAILCPGSPSAAEERSDGAELLWQIGQPDDAAAEFRHGPGGYKSFDRDGWFVVGRSQAREDWPYTHPGPVDGWASGSNHTFRIFFALEEPVAEGPYRLVVDFVDTHYVRPPMLVVAVNGQAVKRYQVPAGASDDSIMGRPEAGKEHRFSVEVPADALEPGLNEITIENVQASWVVYDWLGFEGPASAKVVKPRGTSLQGLRAEPWLMKYHGQPVQHVVAELVHFGAQTDVRVQPERGEPAVVRMSPGERRTVALRIPPVASPTAVQVTVKTDGAVCDERQVVLPPARPREPADWVDCPIGTSTSRWMLYPGPSMPFGMVKLSPDNQQQGWKAGYEYTIDNIAGFSHLHSWTMGGLLTMPAVGPLHVEPGGERDPDAGYRSRFRHETEIAEPGYYSVLLDDYGVHAELTATTRAGFQRYTFPKSDRARILFDLLTPTEYGYQVLDAQVRRVGDREIEGYSRQQSGRHASYQEFTLHFVARTSKPFASMGGWVDGEIRRDVAEIAGKGDVGAWLDFTTKEGEQIQLQTGVSLVSVEQARLNLETEMQPFGWGFDACRKRARTVWNDLLGRIEIEGGRPVDHVKFYTNLYRSYCARTMWSDVNGKYVDMHERVQQLPDADSPVYGCDAFWNTFWNLNPLWNLATPEISDRWVRSLLEIYDRGGWLAKGPTGIEYSSIMVASHEIPFMVAAYQHGIRGYDAEKALEAMVHCQTTPAQPHPGGGHVGNRHLGPYLEHGYVPVGEGAASNTLEYAYDDWCVAQMAKALGHDETYRQFRRRGEFWRNLFDPETGFMRPRRADGSWLEPFDPYSHAGGWVEGNPWQFTWFVPQNVRGLVEALGRERFIERLDEGLAQSAKTDFNAPGDRMATVPINHGNQPSMQAAYLFNHAGAPWLTQKWARSIMENYYGDDPIDGWPGDEDQGQGGAWFVISAMGLFQMDGGCRVDPIYELGSPLFDRVVIHLNPDYYAGETFVIEARDNSPENIYIQSATLDGRPLDRPWFPAKQLLDGGTLSLQMGPEPNEEWGAGTAKAPPAAR